MRRVLLNRYTWLVLFIGWFGVLFYLSSIVPEYPPGTAKLSDKLVHYLYFGLGGGLYAGYILLKQKHTPYLVASLIIFCVIVLVGVFDEWHQTFTPGREGNDFGDMIANSLGGLTSALIAPLLFRFLKRAAEESNP